jgi:DnaJ like chaperone protein
MLARRALSGLKVAAVGEKTADALREAIRVRPKPADAADADLCFLTMRGSRFVRVQASKRKADGHVTASEADAFAQVFRAPPNFQQPIARAFNLAKQTTLGFEGYARQIARRFRANPAVLEDVLDGLFHIARADGRLTRDELAYLARVADIFGFSDREFERIRLGHMGGESSDPYVVLGIDADIADADLKRAYRRIASQNHPDRLIARGAPPELQKLADEKMAAINAAYAKILTERRMAAGTA